MKPDAEYQSAYGLYLDAKDTRLGSGWTEEVRSKMQEAFLRALDPKSQEPLNEEMLFELYEAFQDLCGGFQSQLFRPHKRPGHRQHPTASACIADAVEYLAAVESGAIKDANPIGTVAKAFDVDPRTVRGWKAKRRATGKWPRGRVSAVTALMRAGGAMYRRLVPKRVQAHLY